MLNSWLYVLIYLAVFFGIFYVFVILPRKKQEKNHQKILDSLKAGDKIVSLGGIVGKVKRVSDERIIVNINEDTEMEFVKNAVAYKIEE